MIPYIFPLNFPRNPIRPSEWCCFAKLYKFDVRRRFRLSKLSWSEIRVVVCSYSFSMHTVATRHRTQAHIMFISAIMTPPPGFLPVCFSAPEAVVYSVKTGAYATNRIEISFFVARPYHQL